MSAARKHGSVPTSKIDKGASAEERITYKGLPEVNQPVEALEAELAGTVVDIQGMIDEVLEGKPFKIETEDTFLKGNVLLAKLHAAPISGVNVQIESGGNTEVTDMEMPLLNTTVYGMSVPGAQNERGQYPQNQDGLVMAYDSLHKILTAAIVHNDSSTPEGAAASNLQAASAAYDLSKIREPALTEMFFRMNNRLAPIENDLGNTFPHASIVRLSPMDTKNLFALDVANNGFFRCLVIDTTTGKFESNIPFDTGEDNEFLSTLYDRPVHEVLDAMVESTASEADRLILKNMRENLESGKLDEKQIGKILRNFLMEPRVDRLVAGTGEVVIMVPEAAIQEFGGPEDFAKYFSTLIQNGQSLQNVCQGLVGALKKVINEGEDTTKGTEKFEDVIQEVYPDETLDEEKREIVEKKPLLDQSMSIIAFEVPQTLDK